MNTTTVHGYPILAFAFTETQTGPVECGIILVRKSLPGVGKVEFVTGWFRDGDKEWSHGHYFDRADDAFDDFVKRAKPSW